MANPMQRKARNSFLLGMLLSMIILGAVIALLFLQLTNMQKEQKEREAEKVSVCVLAQDVKSGQVITKDMISTLVVDKKTVPSNATSDASTFSTYALQDKEGNDIITEYEKKNNETIVTMKLQKNNKTYEMKKEESGEYYIDLNGDKEYVQLTESPLVAKVDMNANTVLTTKLVRKSDESSSSDVRKQEYNMVILPIDLETGDYIDVRLMLPNGQDMIVVSKKQVEIPNIAGVDSSDTMWINLNEEEILTMSNAIVDAYMITGAKIYATKYVEAGIQDAATPTYAINAEVGNLLLSDPNILEQAKQALKNRYNEGLRANHINPTIAGETDAKSNEETGMETSITNSLTTREEYLQSLNSGNLEETE